MHNYIQKGKTRSDKVHLDTVEVQIVRHGKIKSKQVRIMDIQVQQSDSQVLKG